jgi:prepilin-type N-terminal cleavage/methylation domain-containing protein
MKFLKSQSGMSLIEVMIAVSILSVISLSVVLLNKNMNKSVKDAEKKSDIDLIMRDIASYLNDKNSCSATFAGMIIPAPTSPTAPGKAFLPSIRTINDAGLVVPIARLAVRDITGLTTNQVVINGMHVERTTDTAGSVDNFVLKVTFVKNPRGANGNAISRDTVMRNFVVKQIPLRLDNCSRNIAVTNNSVIPVVPAPSCASGQQPLGQVFTFHSGAAVDNRNYYSVQVCRSCALKGSISGCL